MYFTNNKLYVWLKEGLATYLSHQFDKYPVCKFNCQLDDLINGGVNYGNYYLLFKYAYENYGIDYIKKLLTDELFMVEQTPILFNSLLSEKNLIK